MSQYITDIYRYFRVTLLEENGGDDGNSSVAELEVRVETLEGTAADHETRLTTVETDIEGKMSQSFKMKKIFIFILMAVRKQMIYFCCSHGNQINSG